MYGIAIDRCLHSGIAVVSMSIYLYSLILFNFIHHKVARNNETSQADKRVVLFAEFYMIVIRAVL